MTARTKRLSPGIAQMLPVKGQVLEGKYRVTDIIGAGGFARVYRATFEDVGREVALKILVPQNDDPARMYPTELVERFHREARAVSELRNPHTITLHDFGRTTNGLLYMIFEYVDGVSLDRLIKREGRLPPHRVVPILGQVLRSLREAHAVGMLHRDIKPANVMVYDYLDQTDCVKLLDFGIAKQWTHAADGQPLHDDLTEDGMVVGTPRYMSPEQIVGQELTPATDIYSLGLVAYEMITGQPAAKDTERTGVVRAHLSPEPFRLPTNVAVPDQLRTVTSRMIAKSLSDRYHNADEVLRALEGADHAVSANGRSQHLPDMAAVSQPAISSTGQPDLEDVTQPVTESIAQTAGGMVVRPQKTFIQIHSSPNAFEVDVPMRPSQRGFIVLAATGLIFVVAFMATSFFWVLTLAPFAWGLSLVFRSYHLKIRPDTGYDLTVSVFGYERAKRGAMASVVRFDALGSDDEDNTVLKLITHEGDLVVANAFSEDENRWVAAEGNAWIERLRARRPNPTQ